MRINPRAARLGVLLAICWASWGAHTAPARAQVPTTRPAAPFEVVPTPPDPAQLIEKLDGQTEGIWLDGEILWLVKNSPDGPWKTIGGVSQPLTQIDDSDVWATGLRWDRWPEAFMKIAFIGNTLPAGPIEYQTWRGEQAPKPPAQSDPGKIDTFQLPGPVQGSERSITVVLPPAFEGIDPLPAIVLADGQSAEAWGKVIESLSHWYAKDSRDLWPSWVCTAAATKAIDLNLSTPNSMSGHGSTSMATTRNDSTPTLTG